ncbi:MAG: hypothetical protein AAGM45_01075 [Cyanobacteria bacterium J06588_5]
MTTQRTVLERAKQGEAAAIAALMNQTLKQKGVQVKVRQSGGAYKLLVESAAEAPEQKPTVRWIVKGLDRLAIASLKSVTIYGKAHQSSKPDWQQSIQFPLQSSQSATRQSVVPASPFPELEQPASAPAVSVETPLDLSEYCFTRNKSLLSGNLTLPSKPVIQCVLAFSDLTNAQKQEALPHIDVALRKSAAPESDKLSGETKNWFDLLAALDGPDVRKGSIWLSRYCLNPSDTVEQLSPAEVKPDSDAVDETTEADNVLKGDADSQPSDFARYSDRGGVKSDRGAAFSSRSGVRSSTQTGGRPKNNGPLVWIIPVVWSFILIFLMFLGINSASSSVTADAAAPQYFPVCSTATGNPQLCTLAVQMVGDEEFFSAMIGESSAMTPEMKTEAAEYCGEYINYEAGLFSEVSDRTPPVLSSQSEEIFPGVLLTDVSQKDATSGSTLRLACIHYAYTDAVADGGTGETWVEEMALDIIPANWPSEPYGGNVAIAALSAAEALGSYDGIIRFFAYPLFSAVGLMLAVAVCSAYTCRSAMGLYQASAVLGMSGILISMLPGFGPITWLIRLPLHFLSVRLTSEVIGGFNVDWQNNYGSLAIGTILLLMIRGVLMFLLSFVLYATVTAMVIAPRIAATI